MAAMTAFRGTPTQAVAATQTTAPVYEFRCLYSHDLRKKKKLWHDGSLRYHTFNKRVMVYDESKNYIGDSHWRDADELQEGTELKLDKGVLVDVGDRIGETQTDLAPLLEKRRLDNVASPQRPPLRPISVAPMSRNTPSHAQARPKSLSDVLGISQGPIGRARLPTQSPYDQQRRPAVQSYCAEPPAKKIRVGSDKGNGARFGDKICSEQRMLKPASAPLIGRPVASGSSNLPGRQAAPAKQVVAIPSGDEPNRQPSSPSTAVLGLKARPAKPSVLLGGPRELPTTSMLPPKMRTETTSIGGRKFTPPQSATSKPLLTPPLKLTHDPLNTSLASLTSLKGKLRLAVQKPRKKLLYEELLPSSNRSESQLRSRTSAPASCSTRVQGQNPHPTRDHGLPEPSAFSNRDAEAIVGTRSLGNTHPSKQPYGKKQDVDRDIAELFAESSSPLFVPEPAATAGSVATGSQESGDFLSLVLDAASPFAPGQNDVNTTPGIDGPTAPRERTLAVTDPLRTAPPLKPTILDQEFTIPSPGLAALSSKTVQNSPQAKSLRRVDSENDSTRHARDQRPGASVVHKVDTVKAVGRDEQLTQQAYRNPVKSTKSLFGGTVKPAMEQRSANTTAKGKSAEECGPWSKVEAYLLFDWYPPGRERLALADRGNTSANVTVVKRGLLFDQADTL